MEEFKKLLKEHRDACDKDYWELMETPQDQKDKLPNTPFYQNTDKSLSDIKARVKQRQDDDDQDRALQDYHDKNKSDDFYR